jgi:UDP-N-acetylmuramoyl-L-alanyl-D-glutamate--2,6-diaminopimelate ligase
MRLGELITVLGAPSAGAEKGAPAGPPPAAGSEVEISELAYDSRRVASGTLFFCVPGLEHDGHAFAKQAVADGAVALVVERPLGLGVPEVRVDSVRAAMGPLAARFYGDPTSELQVVGVTGTNGKTTTAFILRELLEAVGRQCGLLGTVKSIVAGRELPVTRTTPEAIDLQSDFRAMLDGGDGACAIEVSSHALELGRTGAVRFAAAIFTNLTRDHLDFHDTMEDYFQAKRRLFVGPDAPALSVLNAGDPYGRRLAKEIDGSCTFAVDAPADYSASEVHCERHGCSFVLHTPVGEREVALGMPGRFNVANALGALAVAHRLGGDLDALVAALAGGVRVPGRFEPVDEGQDFAVLVDYAHTPDSLENVLAAARELAEQAGGEQPGRVVCVFGAGGDRDRGKRPLMGEAAARLADVVVITSDNPRSEDPEQIIAEVKAGVFDGVRSAEATPATAPSTVESLSDRAAAIARALAHGQPGDVVVIAGKGHEQGQELAGGEKLPFDDVSVAREALRGSALPAAGAPR